jgi:hydrogenase maturation protease
VPYGFAFGQEDNPVQDSRTAVFGVGNPLCGDDGVGSRIIALLEDHDLPQNVRVEDIGTPGLGLPIWLDGQKRVILVDAVQMGQAAGTWRRLDPHKTDFLINNRTFSIHNCSLADGLALSQALGVLPEELILYGVEPGQLEEGYGISPEVEAVLPDIVDSILKEL